MHSLNPVFVVMAVGLVAGLLILVVIMLVAGHTEPRPDSLATLPDWILADDSIGNDDPE